MDVSFGRTRISTRARNMIIKSPNVSKDAVWINTTHSCNFDFFQCSRIFNVEKEWINISNSWNTFRRLSLLFKLRQFWSFFSRRSD